MKTLPALVLGAIVATASATAFATAPIVETLAHLPDGADSWDSMTLAPDGYFYGVSDASANDGLDGFGVVFRYKASDGTLETIAKFSAGSGYYPDPHLVLAPDGNLYGITAYGGTYGCGSVFKIDPRLARPLPVTTGTRPAMPPGLPGPSTATYNIYGDMAPGVLTIITQTPVAVGYSPSPLELGPDGALYGCMATSLSTVTNAYHGSLFKVTTAGVMTKLAGFPVGYDAFPGRVAFGPDGSLYGTAYNGMNGHGHVFHLTATGQVANIADLEGMSMAYMTGITLGSDGNFYGMSGVSTLYGTVDWGTAYRVTPAGELNYLYSSTRATGISPSGGLTPGPDGNFYGVNQNGGANETGNVFQLTPQGTYTVLADFPPRDDATGSLHAPLGGVSFGPDGNVYGTAQSGIFRVDVSLATPLGATQPGKTVTPPAKTVIQRELAADRDYDGISDHLDAYPGTPRSATVNKRGASISQLAPVTYPWKNRAEYVNAVTQAAHTFRMQGLITSTQSSAVIRAALTAKIKLAAAH